MTSWQQATSWDERIAWLTAHVGQRVAYIDNIAWMDAPKTEQAKRFTAPWKTGEIREFDESEYSRGILIDGEAWLRVYSIGDIMELAEYEALQERAYVPTGEDHDSHGAIWDLLEATTAALRETWDTHLYDQQAAPLMEQMIRTMIALGYTRADLMRAWDAQY